MVQASGTSDRPNPDGAELQDRVARLDRLKQQVSDLERIGRYDDARRTRELLAAATEAIQITRFRLTRIEQYRAEAERVRRKAETVQHQLTQQQLLTIAEQYEQMAESIRWMPDSRYDKSR
jgi:hypothetical protein